MEHDGGGWTLVANIPKSNGGQICNGAAGAQGSCGKFLWGSAIADSAVDYPDRVAMSSSVNGNGVSFNATGDMDCNKCQGLYYSPTLLQSASWIRIEMTHDSVQGFSVPAGTHPLRVVDVVLACTSGPTLLGANYELFSNIAANENMPDCTVESVKYGDVSTIDGAVNWPSQISLAVGDVVHVALANQEIWAGGGNNYFGLVVLGGFSNDANHYIINGGGANLVVSAAYSTTLTTANSYGNYDDGSRLGNYDNNVRVWVR